jgi:hypothetical protein
MAWWLRFCLGLPARRQDVEDLRESLPELFDPHVDPEGRLIVPWWPSHFVQELTVGNLRRWASTEGVAKEPAAASPENCPAEECPLRQGPPSRQAANVAVLWLMAAAGAHKPPKDEFLDLVRRVHGQQQIREVILTDPYIYSDLGEEHQPGGYGALIEYLNALRLNPDSHFDLKLNPNPKKTTANAHALLARKVKDAFPGVRLTAFSPRHRFHDRFYLTRDQSGRLAGTFGPSLNGLVTDAIVLMGELEQGVLKRLDQLVSGGRPNKRLNRTASRNR